ncbi:unnamed protein product, partial [Rhizoctonia solani]
MDPYGPPLSEYPAVLLKCFPYTDPWTQEDTKQFLIIKQGIPDKKGTKPLGYYLGELEKYIAKHKLFSHYYGFFYASPHVMYKCQPKSGPTEKDDCSIRLADVGALTFGQYEEFAFKIDRGSLLRALWMYLRDLLPI